MDVETYSAVLVDEHCWDRLTMDGGLRVTRNWYNDYTDVSFNIVGNNLSNQPIENEWDDPALTGTLGAKYQLARPAALYAHAAVGSVDAPPGAAPEDGGSLADETRIILDGGVSMESSALGTLSVGLFAVWREDAILLTTTEITEDGDTFNAYANNNVRQYGLELEGRSARLLNTFTFFGNATVMESERDEEGDWSDYREIPNLIVAAGVHAAVGRFDANLFGKYVSSYENRRFAQDGEYHSLGDFIDLNLTMGLSLGKERATRLYASLENLLNDEYSTVVGYPDYGFQAFVGLQHKM